MLTFLLANFFQYNQGACKLKQVMIALTVYRLDASNLLMYSTTYRISSNMNCQYNWGRRRHTPLRVGEDGRLLGRGGWLIGGPRVDRSKGAAGCQVRWHLGGGHS